MPPLLTLLVLLREKFVEHVDIFTADYEDLPRQNAQPSREGTLPLPFHHYPDCKPIM